MSGSSSDTPAGATGADRHVLRPRVGIRIVILLVLLAVAAGQTGASGTTPAAVAVGNGSSDEGASDDAGWLWPVAGARSVIEPFRAPAHDYGPGHRGMDIAAEGEAVVRAPAAGVVAFRGTVVDRPLITIDHGSGLVSTFEPVTSDLAPGDIVAAGDPIGTMSTGGHAARGTVHVGVRLDDRYINPLPLFGAPPRAVLLPCCE